MRLGDLEGKSIWCSVGELQCQIPADKFLRAEVEYCEDKQPEQQLARATEQHIRSKHALVQQYHQLVNLCGC